MKMRMLLAALSVALFGGFGLHSVRAAERPAGGPLQKILDIAQELELSEDQKTSLKALVKEFTAEHAGKEGMREKAKSNPEMMETLKELKAARESGDEAKLKELRQKLVAEGGGAGGKGEGGRGEIIKKLAEILTPAQLKKLKELREANGGGGGGRGERGGKNKTESDSNDKTNKPDASKGVPNPFE